MIFRNDKGIHMHKLITSTLLLTSLLCISLFAMEYESKIGKLTFTLAQKDEDLSVYEAIAINRFLPYFKTPDEKERIEKSLKRQFPILVSWIGQKGRLFIKVEKQLMPYGFLTLQALNNDETKITFNLSIIPDLEDMGEYIDCVKERFPHIKSLYTYARNQSLADYQKKLGFIKDDSYVPNKELIPDPAGFFGFRKDFNQSSE